MNIVHLNKVVSLNEMLRDCRNKLRTLRNHPTLIKVVIGNEGVNIEERRVCIDAMILLYEKWEKEIVAKIESYGVSFEELPPDAEDSEDDE